MKVDQKTLVVTGLTSFVGGMVIGRRLDPLIKAIDTTYAGSLLLSRRSIQFLSIGAFAGVAYYLIRSDQQLPEKAPEPSKKPNPSPTVIKDDSPKPVETIEYKPAVRNVENTDAKLKADEKNAVRAALHKAGVSIPNEGKNKEWRFWFEMIQWLQDLGKNSLEDEAAKAPVYTTGRGDTLDSVRSYFAWNGTKVLHIWRWKLTKNSSSAPLMISTFGENVMPNYGTTKIDADTVGINCSNFGKLISCLLTETWKESTKYANSSACAREIARRAAWRAYGVQIFLKK